jgi:hypothetical protein
MPLSQADKLAMRQQGYSDSDIAQVEARTGNAPVTPDPKAVLADIAKEKGAAYVENQLGLGSATGAGAAEGSAAATTGIGSLGTASALGVGAGVGVGALLTAKGVKDTIDGKNDTSGVGTASRAQAAASTFGFSELARPFMGHVSTRDVAKQHTAELMGQGKDNQPWQDYVAGMRKQFESGPPDPSKPFAGKYGSWDEYKAAGLDAGDLTGVHGNLATFGPDWAGYSDQQRRDLTQLGIDNNLYNSSKGEVEVTDPNAFKALQADYLAGKLKPSKNVTEMAKPGVAPQDKTLPPGTTVADVETAVGGAGEGKADREKAAADAKKQRAMGAAQQFLKSGPQQAAVQDYSNYFKR